MALVFTKKQELAIRDAWNEISGAVESNTFQEGRLRRCLKESMKHFGPVMGRLHLISEINAGWLGPITAETMCHRVADHEERILAFMVGVWIRDRSRGTEGLRLSIREALDAYLEAQREYHGI